MRAADRKPQCNSSRFCNNSLCAMTAKPRQQWLVWLEGGQQGSTLPYPHSTAAFTSDLPAALADIFLFLNAQTCCPRLAAAPGCQAAAQQGGPTAAPEPRGRLPTGRPPRARRRRPATYRARPGARRHSRPRRGAGGGETRIQGAGPARRRPAGPPGHGCRGPPCGSPGAGGGPPACPGPAVGAGPARGSRCEGASAPREPHLPQTARGLAVQGRVFLFMALPSGCWLLVSTSLTFAATCRSQRVCVRCIGGGLVLQNHREALTGCQARHESLIVPQPSDSPKLTLFLQSLLQSAQSQRGT